MSVLTLIGNALGLLDHLWQAYQTSGMVQAKVAQLSQDDQDKHKILIAKAMAAQKDHETALAEIRKLTAE